MKRISWLFNGRLLGEPSNGQLADSSVQQHVRQNAHHHNRQQETENRKTESDQSSYTNQTRQRSASSSKQSNKKQAKHQSKHKGHHQESGESEESGGLSGRNQLAHSSRSSAGKQKTKQRLKSKRELITGQPIERITFRNEDRSLMSINSASRLHNGRYECLTSNSIGSTHSEPVTLDIKCEYWLVVIDYWIQ